MRDCNKCVYHTSGECSSWDCNFTTIEDVKNNAIDDYYNELCKSSEIAINTEWVETYRIVPIEKAEEICKQLKEVKKNANGLV